MDQDVFEQMFQSFASPEIQGCLAAVTSIAGFELLTVDRQPFLYFHNYVTNPQPEFITKWRSDPQLEKWYHRFVNGFLGDVQNTFACVLYHYRRLKAIESAVIEEIEKFDYRRVIGNSTIALGNTLAWDFEYQAFILAYRRCLDYLARAVSTYFRNDFHSFRALGKFLGKLKQGVVTQVLISVHEKYSPLFEFVLSEGNRKSLRDKISHYEYVPVGTINLSQRGFVLAGGGEKLGLSHNNGAVTLSEVLDSHITNLKGCVREIIFGFVDAVRVEQSNV
ncbi:MAG: hypothetical protein EBT06_03965 [Gammaproteobacteria bacterium]|jgi:hypothetical protein|nr:hypothetical protein [Gammaproteobacteria bacterium]NBT44072.1 hypothetical protein [Gammaproteobacteria bacterium]NBY21359.1 hypothetical protein [Gammaproteobacteria bacterium]